MNNQNGDVPTNTSTFTYSTSPHSGRLLVISPYLHFKCQCSPRYPTLEILLSFFILCLCDAVHDQSITHSVFLCSRLICSNAYLMYVSVCLLYKYLKEISPLTTSGLQHSMALGMVPWFPATLPQILVIPIFFWLPCPTYILRNHIPWFSGVYFHHCPLN